MKLKKLSEQMNVLNVMTAIPLYVVMIIAFLKIVSMNKHA